MTWRDPVSTPNGAVIFTINGFRPGDNWDAGSWRWKNRRRDGERARPATNMDPNDIVTPIAPGPRDIMIVKQKPSGSPTGTQDRMAAE